MVISAFRVGRTSPNKPYGPNIFFVWRFLTIDLTSLTGIGLLKWSISSSVSFANLCVSRNLPISPTSPNLLIKLFVKVPYCYFDGCCIYSNVLSHLMLIICVLSPFFPYCLAGCWMAFITFLKNQYLILWIFPLLFFSAFYFIDFWSSLYCFLYSPYFGSSLLLFF